MIRKNGKNYWNMPKHHFKYFLILGGICGIIVNLIESPVIGILLCALIGLFVGLLLRDIERAKSLKQDSQDSQDGQEKHAERTSSGEGEERKD